MQRKLSRLLTITSLLLAVVPCIPVRAHARQTGAGIAGGGRVARGKNDSRSTSPRPFPRGPAAPARQPTSEGAEPRISEIESLEQQCLDEVNRVRRNKRLTQLTFYEDLLPIAREYSRRMAEERFFSHSDSEGRTVRDRVDGADIPWQMLGENLAYSNGYVNPVAASLHGWLDSPGHRRNILDPDFRLTAIGAWVSPDGTVYFTEIFLKQ